MEEGKRDTPAKWEKWAVGKKPSMKRRCEQHDYYDRGIYMITMNIEGRRPLLGTLCDESAPHVVLSAFGERVKQCWLDIPRYYPVVEPMKLCIMPDHIHGILFVHERMDKHLGKVIDGFKTGTRKAARELGYLPVPQAQATEPATPSTSVPYTAPQAQSRHTAAARAHGLLWEAGYNDRLLRGKNQLQRMIATAAMKEHIPLIVLLLNGFPQHFKPQPRYLEACAEGRLLMLAPFPHQNEKLNNMRQRCLQLNALAAQICEN